VAKIWVLQHHPVENLGLIANSLEEAALAWQYVRVFDGAAIPKDMNGAGGLIVMGGPESVYRLDRYPYLRDEIRLIESALHDNKPILGVCLGAQLLAAALAATVRRGSHQYESHQRALGRSASTRGLAETRLALGNFDHEDSSD
jgi:GMP synthase-like glutamine amidotransferase